MTTEVCIRFCCLDVLYCLERKPTFPTHKTASF